VQNVLTSKLLEGTVYEEQMRLERWSIEEGERRYFELAKQAASRNEATSLKPVERMIGHWFNTMVASINSTIEKLRAGEPQENYTLWGPVIMNMKPEKLATITLHTVMSKLIAPTIARGTTVQDGDKYTAVVCAIGRNVLAEAAWKMIAKDEFGIARPDEETLLQRFRKQCGASSIANVRWFTGKTLPPNLLDRGFELYVGDFLFYRFFESCKINDVRAIEITKVVLDNKTYRWVKLSEETRDMLRWMHKTRAELRPSYLPMVVEPMPWQQDDSGVVRSGGYIQIHTPLVTKPTRSHKQLIKKHNVRKFLEHFNLIHKSALTPHHAMMDIVQQAWKTASPQVLAKLKMPPNHLVPMPDKAGVGATDDEVNAAKGARARAYKDNVTIQSHRCGVETIMRAIEWMRGYEKLWLPHQIDSRTRSYAIPTQFSFQGSQWQRVLLQFHRSKPLNDHGRYWLAVHTANSWGYDKVSFDDRVAWTENHMYQIVNAGRKGLADEWWMEAKQPLPFLAACRAWAYPEEAARIAVEFDASANGLQHFSAMGLDPIGAAAVNLTPRDKPADPYGDVMAVAIGKCNDTPLGKQAKALITRDFAKSLVMPMSYGQTEWKAKELTSQHLIANGYGDAVEKWKLRDDALPLWHYLHNTMQASIGTTFSKAVEIMKWMSQCAKAITSDDGKPNTNSLWWVTPLGFPVEQSYMQMAQSTFKTLAGKISMEYEDDCAPSIPQKQASAATPNTVHSFDATHKYMTCRAVILDGGDFRHRHDAYGSHANDADMLHRHARQEFVNLHSMNLLDFLYQQWKKQNSSIPEPPQRGSFDLSQVLGNTYTFH